jgi:endonuclease-3 related protein
MNARKMRAVFRRLFDQYGPQGWWPADSPFEVMVGAVLVQNTAWSNVEQAIAGLAARGALYPERILALPDLAEVLRPSGCFRVKADRLRSLCRWFLASGGLAALEARPTAAIRAELLAVHGVGPETADDILLYALERPVFVIDAYTRRLFARFGLIGGQEDYETLRARIERALGPDVPLYQEYHALIVRHAKGSCRTRPGCERCCLAPRCARAA